jgi:hypothetical protein
MPRVEGAPVVTEEEKLSIVQQLVDLANKESTLFVDERGKPCASVANDKGTFVMAIRSEAYKRWLAVEYRKGGGKPYSTETERTALRFVEADAVAGGTVFELFNRFAFQKTPKKRNGVNDIFIDLAKGRGVIHVTPRKWEVQFRPPILFRSFSHQKAHPIPTTISKTQQILKFLNIRRDEDAVLTLVWLVTACFVDVPRPILCFHGPQGSAKTTAAKILGTILDPSETPVITPKHYQAEWTQVLDHHAVPVFDNLPKLQNWQADMLCRAVTGDSISKRQLYTDDEDVIASYKRAIILSGINIPSVQPDLLDRLLMIELKRISPSERKQERQLWAEFEEARPSLFAGLCETIMLTMRYYKNIKTPLLPRMADFGALGCAAAKALGYKQKDFVKAFDANTKRQHREVLESQPIARAVIRLMNEKGLWTGTASQLSGELRRLVQGEEDDFAPQMWPSANNALTRALRNLQATFVDNGINLEFMHNGCGMDRQRIIRIEDTRPIVMLRKNRSHRPIRKH